MSDVLTHSIPLHKWLLTNRVKSKDYLGFDNRLNLLLLIIALYNPVINYELLILDSLMLMVVYYLIPVFLEYS